MTDTAEHSIASSATSAHPDLAAALLAGDEWRHSWAGWQLAALQYTAVAAAAQA